MGSLLCSFGYNLLPDASLLQSMFASLPLPGVSTPGPGTHSYKSLWVSLTPGWAIAKGSIRGREGKKTGVESTAQPLLPQCLLLGLEPAFLSSSPLLPSRVASRKGLTKPPTLLKVTVMELGGQNSSGRLPWPHSFWGLRGLKYCSISFCHVPCPGTSVPLDLA